MKVQTQEQVHAAMVAQQKAAQQDADLHERVLRDSEVIVGLRERGIFCADDFAPGAAGETTDVVRYNQTQSSSAGSWSAAACLSYRSQQHAVAGDVSTKQNRGGEETGSAAHSRHARSMPRVSSAKSVRGVEKPKLSTKLRHTTSKSKPNTPKAAASVAPRSIPPVYTQEALAQLMATIEENKKTLVQKPVYDSRNG